MVTRSPLMFTLVACSQRRRTVPDDLLEELPAEARPELDQGAREITVRDSMIYRDGKNWDGPTPRLRTHGRLMVTYLNDVRGERVVTFR